MKGRQGPSWIEVGSSLHRLLAAGRDGAALTPALRKAASETLAELRGRVLALIAEHGLRGAAAELGCSVNPLVVARREGGWLHETAENKAVEEKV